MAEDSPLMQIIAKRQSIRKFLSKPVEREKIISCIEAARQAPSGVNAQPWRFIVIDEVELKEKFCRAAFSGIYKLTKWATRAPVIIVICAKPNIVVKLVGEHLQDKQYHLLDIGICGEHLMLRAFEQGLGGCWIGWFNAKKTQEILNLPKKWHPTCLIALGYYDEPKKKRKGKKPLSEICFFNSPAEKVHRFFRKDEMDRRLTGKSIVVAAVVAGIIAGAFFAFGYWVSTLPAITPVSLCLAFRPLTRLLVPTGIVWVIVFAFLLLRAFSRHR